MRQSHITLQCAARKGADEMMTIQEMNDIREELGLTYQKICQMSGVPIGTVQKVLGGVTKNPRMDTMQRLEETLGGMKRAYNQFELSMRGSADHMSENRKGMVQEASVHYKTGRRSENPGFSENGQTVRAAHVYTAEEREKFPEERRTELIDGVIYDMAAPSLPHQTVARMVCRQLEDCMQEHHADCQVYMAPADVCLDRDQYTVVQPDVFIVCDRSQITRKNIQGAPAFILEVLSPATMAKDKKIKLMKYLNAGVKEYWMIDPDQEKVIVFDMTGNKDNMGNGDSDNKDGNQDKNRRVSSECVNAYSLTDDPYDIAIYGFRDEIPLAISHGECVINMNPIRERLKDLYSD